MATVLTPELLAYVGIESEWEECWDEVERGQIRRHAQALMDDDPIYWDDNHAKDTRLGGVVAPPLFPLHALRAPAGSSNQFAHAAGDPDFDGSTRGVMKGLPPVPVPLTRILNGGNEVEVYQLARPGERIRVRSRYAEMYEREGRTGPMVFLITETQYHNNRGELLLKARQIRILR